jgi:hypothetical protein
MALVVVGRLIQQVGFELGIAKSPSAHRGITARWKRARWPT